jgi:hypothetical protein
MRREERGITWVAAARVLAYKLEAWKAGLGAITAATVTLFYEHAKCHSDYANERFNPQRTVGVWTERSSPRTSIKLSATMSGGPRAQRLKERDW